MHIAMAEWLISRMLSLCDEGRELDRGETLRLKMNRKLGFASEKWEVDRDELLWTQTSFSHVALSHFTTVAICLHTYILLSLSAHAQMRSYGSLVVCPSVCLLPVYLFPWWNLSPSICFYVLNIILSICQIFEIKLGCGIIIRIHCLEASKASNKCRYSFRRLLWRQTCFTTWNFMCTTAIAPGLKPGIAILQSLNYYTRCKFHTLPTSSLGVAIPSVPCSRSFYDSGWSPTIYQVWSGYFGQFMYMCAVVHCAQHWGISTTGVFITTVAIYTSPHLCIPDTVWS